jgi:REP element-mobilizing transposase RayT
MSRTTAREYLFGAAEKECFRKMMRRIAQFSGINVLTYCLMDNHFHLLIEVPNEGPTNLSDEELVKRVAFLYDRFTVKTLKKRLQQALADNDVKAYYALREQYEYRMENLSEFMKALKQRYSVWYNRTHGRKGTLWEERFKSVLIESPQHDQEQKHIGPCALSTVAAYIDLNAVRANIVADPKDYRWCGCADALGGTRLALTGLKRLMELKEGGTAAAYDAARRYHGYVASKRCGPPLQCGKSEGVGKGQLSLSDMLRCHVRYFNDGLVIGSRGFVDGFFEEHRHLFGEKRRSGARRMKGGGWNDLCAIRDLQKEALSVS